MSRCLSCNVKLSSREMTRKYANYDEIPNIWDQYVQMCTRCTHDSGISFVDNTEVSDTDGEDQITNTDPEYFYEQVDEGVEMVNFHVEEFE